MTFLVLNESLYTTLVWAVFDLSGVHDDRYDDISTGCWDCHNYPVVLGNQVIASLSARSPVR
jgi:hypothetical protein